MHSSDTAVITRFFISNTFFQLSVSVGYLFHEWSFKCCLGVAWFIIYICVIFVSCLDLGLFMSYLCFLVFILIFIFIMIHEYRYTCSFAYFLEYILLFCEQKIILTIKECEQSSDSKSSVSGCCLAFAWFFVSFSLTLLIKVLLIKKACTWIGFENTM